MGLDFRILVNLELQRFRRRIKNSQSARPGDMDDIIESVSHLYLNGNPSSLPQIVVTDRIPYKFVANEVSANGLIYPVGVKSVYDILEQISPLSIPLLQRIALKGPLKYPISYESQADEENGILIDGEKSEVLPRELGVKYVIGKARLVKMVLDSFE